MEECDALDSLFLARSHCAQCARCAVCERGDDLRLGRRGRMTCSGGGTAARDELRQARKQGTARAVRCL
jgi:hypothetical protein